MGLVTRATTTAPRGSATRRDATTRATRSRLGLSRARRADGRGRATRVARAGGAFYENPNEIAHVDGVNEAQREIYDAVNASGAPGARAGPVVPRDQSGSPFDSLLRNRIVFLGSQVDDFNADAVISQLLLLDQQDPTKEIKLFINSPGGSVTAGMGIYDAMQFCRAPVSTVCLGLAASMGAFLLASGEGSPHVDAERAHHDSPAARRGARERRGHRNPSEGNHAPQGQLEQTHGVPHRTRR